MALLLFVGVGFNFGWGVVVALWLLSAIGGVGWFVALRPGTGCLVLLLRGVSALFMLGAALNASGDQPSLVADRYLLRDSLECYECTLQDLYIALSIYVLMPFGSGLLLIRSIRTYLTYPFGSEAWLVSTVRGVALAGVLMIALPLALGWLFVHSSVGQSTLSVRNETDKALTALYDPGDESYDSLAAGETRTLKPLNRFDDPSSVTFVVENVEGTLTYWQCPWDVAKAQEPLVIDDANSAGCEKRSITSEGEEIR